MMDMHNTKTNLGGVGVLTMAFGDERYVRQAENLALSLAHNMPSLPVSVITDRRSVSELFDYAIRLDSSFGLGTVQKSTWIATPRIAGRYSSTRILSWPGRSTITSHDC